MMILRQKRLTLLAVFGLAHWFFGNLYEAFVFSPNWVVDSAAQMKRLNEFLVNTSPTLYFVPLTQLATVLVWVLWAFNRDEEVKVDYQRAGLWSLLLTVLNVFIVVTVITKLFAIDYLSHADELASYCWRWNTLKLFRMALTATTAAYLFNAFRKLDRR
jgi:hypothetical protein